MNNAEACHFLTYTTGSSVLISQRISVTFNGLTGLARRPIGHTRGCILELPQPTCCMWNLKMNSNQF